jgi:hypothetical protein
MLRTRSLYTNEYIVKVDRRGVVGLTIGLGRTAEAGARGPNEHRRNGKGGQG